MRCWCTSIPIKLCPSSCQHQQWDLLVSSRWLHGLTPWRHKFFLGATLPFKKRNIIALSYAHTAMFSHSSTTTWPHGRHPAGVLLQWENEGFVTRRRWRYGKHWSDDSFQSSRHKEPSRGSLNSLCGLRWVLYLIKLWCLVSWIKTSVSVINVKYQIFPDRAGGEPSRPSVVFGELATRAAVEIVIVPQQIIPFSHLDNFMVRGRL